MTYSNDQKNERTKIYFNTLQNAVYIINIHIYVCILHIYTYVYFGTKD